MFIQKNDLLLVSLFYLGIISSVFGTFSFAGVNLHFFLVAFSLFIALFLLISFNKVRKLLIILPLIFLIIFSFIRINGEFGILQSIYILTPFLYFLIGSSYVFDINFYNKFIFFLKRTNIILFIFYMLYFLIGVGDIATRWSSIFISVISLLSLVLINNIRIKFISLSLIFFVLASGSRGAILSLFVSYLISYFFIRFKKIYSISLSFILLIIISLFYKNILELIFKIDYLRERTFFDGIYSFDRLQNIEFNTSGRDVAWPTYWQHIEERNINLFYFLFGEGPGSASIFGVSRLGTSWFHPHNEIIRIIFDYGYLGLIIFLTFWIYIFLKYVKNRNYISAVILPLILFTFFIMLTDNPLLYPLYYGNLVLFILGLSLVVYKK